MVGIAIVIMVRDAVASMVRDVFVSSLMPAGLRRGWEARQGLGAIGASCRVLKGVLVVLLLLRSITRPGLMALGGGGICQGVWHQTGRLWGTLVLWPPVTTTVTLTG